MYVCMYVCVYVCMYVCTYVRMFVCMYVCMCVYMCLYVCMYVCMCVCMYVCMCVYVFVCVYVCMYVCVWVYVCMYAGAILYTHGLEKLQNVLARGRHLCSQLFIFEGSLAQLLRFWCRQCGKLRKSRRIASFLTLSRSKIEEVSQNCHASDVVKFARESVAELLRFQACR